jgi:DNA-binding response OmpR family regulator
MSLWRFNVLLIEDEPIIRELVTSMLVNTMVHVDYASTGNEGLKLAKTNKYDLFLVDIVLPQLDGISLCRLLKADPRTQEIPLYMVTAKKKQVDIDAGIRAGADGYIQKPFRANELLDLIEQLRLKKFAV